LSFQRQGYKGGIKTRFEKRFEANLSDARNALFKKGGVKKYDKVLEKIGRLKEKYKRVALRYEVTVEKDEQSKNAINICWNMKQIDDTRGYYVLQTIRTKLRSHGISHSWSTIRNILSTPSGYYIHDAL
jgi:hypothetical protein